MRLATHEDHMQGREALPDGGDARRPLRIGIAGYGTVGQAVARLVADHPAYTVTAILARDPHKPRGYPAPVPITTDIATFAAARPDIVVEATCCDGTGVEICRQMLTGGVDIVSASKRVIAGHHQELATAAAASGTRLLYSPAVGGGAPVLETIDTARAAGEIQAVVATMNGTVNFILDRMAAGVDFAQALSEAQAAGLAEADPEADLSGEDAAAKLRIAALHAFGTRPESLPVLVERLDATAIARVAASGARWVQVARLERQADGPRASVRLEPLADVPGLEAGEGEWNAACVTLGDGRSFRCGGRGAGGVPTAESVLCDLARIAASRRQSARAASC